MYKKIAIKIKARPGLALSLRPFPYRTVDMIGNWVVPVAGLNGLITNTCSMATFNTFLHSSSFTQKKASFDPKYNLTQLLNFCTRKNESFCLWIHDESMKKTHKEWSYLEVSFDRFITETTAKTNDVDLTSMLEPIDLSHRRLQYTSAMEVRCCLENLYKFTSFLSQNLDKNAVEKEFKSLLNLLLKNLSSIKHGFVLNQVFENITSYTKTFQINMDRERSVVQLLRVITFNINLLENYLHVCNNSEDVSLTYNSEPYSVYFKISEMDSNAKKRERNFVSYNPLLNFAIRPEHATGELFSLHRSIKKSGSSGKDVIRHLLGPLAQSLMHPHSKIFLHDASIVGVDRHQTSLKMIKLIQGGQTFYEKYLNAKPYPKCDHWALNCHFPDYSQDLDAYELAKSRFPFYVLKDILFGYTYCDKIHRNFAQKNFSNVYSFSFINQTQDFLNLHRDSQLTVRQLFSGDVTSIDMSNSLKSLHFVYLALKAYQFSDSFSNSPEDVSQIEKTNLVENFVHDFEILLNFRVFTFTSENLLASLS